MTKPEIQTPAIAALDVIVRTTYAEITNPGAWPTRSQANLKLAFELFREALFDFEKAAGVAHALDATIPDIDSKTPIDPDPAEPNGRSDALSGLREELEVVEAESERRRRTHGPQGKMETPQLAAWAV